MEITIQYSQDNLIVNKAVFSKEKGTILIGRKPDCDIVVNVEGMSREQCIIYYDQEHHVWLIRDGKDKPSGSGTWLFIDHHYHIRQSFKFMLGQSLISLEVKNK
jgi:pSer/pThr/pTyr-binding forkhead associated (FHA) protein